MRSVYIETTVIGNIAGRLHPDPRLATRQTVSRTWWQTAADRYELFVSALVIAESGGGDPTAAEERMVILKDLPLLPFTPEVRTLAESLINAYAVPASEPRDATHVATAAVSGIDYLATWNFKHIHNPATQHLIEQVCRDSGYEPATICTPEQLLETHDDE